MDFNNLPEPWKVETYYGEGIWRKPPGCRVVYMHLRGAGGNGGNGQSGAAGTKRAGGSGGTGGWINNYFGPAFLFDDVLYVSAAKPAVSGQGSDTLVWFASGNPGFAEFRVGSGFNGNPGVDGTGGPGASYAGEVSATGLNVPMGIIRIQRENMVGRGIAADRSVGGYAGGSNTAYPGSILGICNGAGGAGITDTYTAGSSGNQGGVIVTSGGVGNGILSTPGNPNFLSRGAEDVDGGAGSNGTTAWLPGKAMYLSIGGGGGSGSFNGTGGRGGDGGVGCGGGGGGGGVTGGAGGRGGSGIVMILSW